MPNPPLVPRRVLVELSCGHAVTLALPPEIDPGPGYTLHCYACGHAVQVVSLTPQLEPRSAPKDDLAAVGPLPVKEFNSASGWLTVAWNRE